MKKPAFLSLVLLAFAGMCFCLFSLWDTSGVFCLNAGCSIYKGYEIFGVSFYWIGAFAFFFLGLLAFLPRARFWLKFFTAFGLLANILFLGYQILYWPCSSCLMVAVILGLFAFFLFRGAAVPWRMVLVLWLLFFAGAGFGAIRDSVQPTPVLARNQPENSIFFSVSCPACKHLVETLIRDKALFEKTEFYPVLKSEGDLARLVSLKKKLDAGTDPEKAFDALWAEEAPPFLSWREALSWRFAFEKNKMIFARFGEDRVPLVLSTKLVHFGKSAAVPGVAAEPEGCSLSSEDSGSCTSEEGKTSRPKEW